MINRLYDVEKYNFQSILSKTFSIDDLSQIHKLLAKEYKVFNVDTDQNTEIHKLFYSTMKKEFIGEYEKFVKNEISARRKEKILFQRYPTFRVSLPNNVAVGGFHKDSDYNHDSKEINFFLPFTKAFDTNTIWFQSKNGLYQPMNCKVGEFVEWDGANTMHGNKTNTTMVSRVSIDFRIISLQDYNSMNSNKSSITNNVKFDTENYWKEMI